MSLLRLPIATSLRASLPRSATASFAGPSNINSLCRSFASTSLHRSEAKSDSKGESTYSAILASLTDSLDKSGRSGRLADGSYNTPEDLEAEWATRPIYGDPNWPATPYSGRSVNVNASGDVNRAFIQLTNILGRNSVRRELKLGERFEKPNRERNRKKSERHRRRFADMVRRKVQLVSLSLSFSNAVRWD